jgi:hypothetical protein
MKAGPFQSPNDIRFRSVNGTSLASESYLIGVDFWKNGFNRIMTVPSVRLPYSLGEYVGFSGRRQYNDWKGDRANLTQMATEEKIKWVSEPPAKVEWYPYNIDYSHAEVGLSLR